MSRQVNVWAGLAVIVAAGVWASSASGQVVFGPGGYGFGFFNYNDNQPRIPYYALYPPVYYSYPVARPYGYSPFAYPPGVMTPDAPTPAAATYFNPYVVPADGQRTKPRSKPPADQTTSAPRTYHNPFVAGNPVASEPVLARRDGR